jgi:hypothetical protein
MTSTILRTPTICYPKDTIYSKRCYVHNPDDSSNPYTFTGCSYTLDNNIISSQYTAGLDTSKIQDKESGINNIPGTLIQQIRCDCDNLVGPPGGGGVGFGNPLWDALTDTTAISPSTGVTPLENMDNVMKGMDITTLRTAAKQLACKAINSVAGRQAPYLGPKYSPTGLTFANEYVGGGIIAHYVLLIIVLYLYTARYIYVTFIQQRTFLKILYYPTNNAGAPLNMADINTFLDKIRMNDPTGTQRFVTTNHIHWGYRVAIFCILFIIPLIAVAFYLNDTLIIYHRNKNKTDNESIEQNDRINNRLSTFMSSLAISIASFVAAMGICGIVIYRNGLGPIIMTIFKSLFILSIILLLILLLILFTAFPATFIIAILIGRIIPESHIGYNVKIFAGSAPFTETGVNADLTWRLPFMEWLLVLGDYILNKAYGKFRHGTLNGQIDNLHILSRYQSASVAQGATHAINNLVGSYRKGAANAEMYNLVQ